MKGMVCFILNYAPHYRTEVFARIDQEIPSVFYFGNETFAKGIKKVDYGIFKQYPKELKFIVLFRHFNWLKGSVGLVFHKSYQKFVQVGEPFCLSSWLILLFSKIVGKPCYLWSHGWYGDEKGLKRVIKKLYFKLAAGVFLYGDYARELMIDEGFSSTRLHVVYNSLYYQQQLALRAHLVQGSYVKQLFGNNKPVVFFIGRISPKKRLGLLLDALHYAMHTFQFPFNVLIVGNGESEDALKLQSKTLGISEFVHFYGACYDEATIAQLVFNSDVCVSPGQLGLTGIHALSYGTPVITHNNFPAQMPEFEAIKAGVTGNFFTDGSYESLAQSILDWLTTYPQKTQFLIDACYHEIDVRYNPAYQLEIFKKVLLKD